jgi:hypothetical protein
MREVNKIYWLIIILIVNLWKANTQPSTKNTTLSMNQLITVKDTTSTTDRLSHPALIRSPQTLSSPLNLPKSLKSNAIITILHKSSWLSYGVPRRNQLKRSPFRSILLPKWSEISCSTKCSKNILTKLKEPVKPGI